MASAFLHGWISLPTRGEVYVDHGVPRRMWVRPDAAADVERLRNEIAELTGLRVTLRGWEPSEEPGALEAAVRVSAEDIVEVLRRLAHASAETFYDRYRRPIGAGDTDFGEEAYAQDLGVALEFCGLGWQQAAQMPGLRESYERELRADSEEIAGESRPH